MPTGIGMSQEGWDELAAWRDRRMGERGDLWHRSIIDPPLLRLVGHVRGLRLLDLGCGNGYLTRRWARAGAASALGVDASGASLRFARRREARRRTGARFLRSDAAHLVGVATGSVDVAVAHMSLMDIADAAGTIREVGRVLAPGGRFVFSVSHPCFDVDMRSAWEVEHILNVTTVYRKVTGYRTEHEFDVPWRVSPTTVRSTRSYHRPLERYMEYLRAAGLVVTRLVEPRPGPEAVRKSPQGPLMLEIPLHLVVEAVQWPLPPRPRGPTQRASRRSARSPAGGAPRSGSRGRRRGTGSSHPSSMNGS